VRRRLPAAALDGIAVAPIAFTPPVAIRKVHLTAFQFRAESFDRLAAGAARGKYLLY